jgi:FkbH-like protein
MTQSQLFSTVMSLRKSGQIADALDHLRDAHRRGQLDPEGVDRAGRFLAKYLPGSTAQTRPVRILVVGQCTTSWLVPAITATAWGSGIPAIVSEGGYDTVLQDLHARTAGEEKPDVVILLPWFHRPLDASASSGGSVTDDLEMWRQAWVLATEQLRARVLQVGYDWLTPGPLGHALSGQSGGLIDRIREANARLRDELPRGSYFLDLEQVAGMIGRETFYDIRRYHWTKQPFSERGVCRLAEHLWAGTRALTTGPKKVLVLDLDNTIWGGVVGELGPLGIALGDSPDGEAFRAFQRHVKGLAERGVVLAVASKNNPADAREPFEKNPDMVLRLDDFAALEINWEPKGATIARLAQTLDLGLDSFVFFDDNPAEREQVRQALPEVDIVDVPEDPAEYVRALQAGLWFEAASLTDADRERAAQYTVERQRRETKESFTSIDDYLRSLEMFANVRNVDDADLQRVVQLLAKTNQFNLTTRRHTRDDVLRMLATPRSVLFTLRLRDRFGDYGLVALMIAIPEDGDSQDALRIDTWLMSCRVIGRTVEQYLIDTLIARARDLGYRRLIGEYIPTKKNGLVAKLYETLSFRQAADSNGQLCRFELDLDGGERPVTFVTADPGGS